MLGIAAIVVSGMIFLTLPWLWQAHEHGRFLQYQEEAASCPLARTVLIAALVLASLQEAAAGPFSVQIHVNAVVLARTKLQSLRQPAMLMVTGADVRRGSVEVRGASLFEIRNNSPAGCVLTFASNNFPFREAVVTVMGREIIVKPTGGMIVLQVRGTQQIALDYRFVLSSEAHPGTYAWPFTVSADPL